MKENNVSKYNLEKNISNIDKIKNLSENWDYRYEGNEYFIYIQRDAKNKETGFIRLVKISDIHHKKIFNLIILEPNNIRKAMYFQKE